MAKFYVTYGNDAKLKNCYSEIDSDCYHNAHAEVMRVTKGNFAFFLDARDFEAQFKPHMTKVDLQPATSTVW